MVKTSRGKGAWHNAIIYKMLHNYGMPTSFDRTIASFLNNRKLINIGKENPVLLQAGTPQGSVLSPTLYILYVNDIPLNTVAGCKGGQYADDVSGWASGVNENQIKIKIQKALDAISS